MYISVCVSVSFMYFESHHLSTKEFPNLVAISIGYCQNWLLGQGTSSQSEGTSSQSEGYSSNWLFWLVCHCGEPLPQCISAL